MSGAQGSVEVEKPLLLASFPNTADRQLLCVTRARQQQRRQWLCGRAPSRLLCNVECGLIGPFLPCKSKPRTRMRRYAATGPPAPETRQIARYSERLRGIAVLPQEFGIQVGSMPFGKGHQVNHSPKRQENRV